MLHEVVGVAAFEEPTGGAPVAVVFGGLADGAEEFDVNAGFGAGDLAGEVGVEDGGTAGGARAAVRWSYRSVGVVRFGWSLVVVRGLWIV